MRMSCRCCLQPAPARSATLPHTCIHPEYPPFHYRFPVCLYHRYTLRETSHRKAAAGTCSGRHPSPYPRQSLPTPSLRCSPAWHAVCHTHAGTGNIPDDHESETDRTLHTGQSECNNCPESCTPKSLHNQYIPFPQNHSLYFPRHRYKLSAGFPHP